MTQAGGPAAINGFLYQLIHHLGWMASVSLTGTLDGAELKDARLILEPRDGGDARAEGLSNYLVEQYKTREGGTWSTADIVSVLTDLRKAVAPRHPAKACYRFVTDGRPGQIEAFIAFLADVTSVTSPNDLNSSEKKVFGSKLVATNREFFDHVVKATRAPAGFATNGETATVFHLLSHFKLEFDSSAVSRAAEIEKLLRRYAPDLGDERGIRERLVGALMEILSKGETALDTEKIDALFRDVGLNTKRLRRLAALAEALGALTQRRMARLGYHPDQDVRDAPAFPKGKPVLVISGVSGTGKTWQLGRLLEALGQEREVTTVVIASRTQEEVLTQAARDVWQSGLQETSEKSVVAISHFLKELIPGEDARQITVAVDDVQNVDLARALVRQDWSDWGMRLVMTAPNAVALALQVSDSNAVHVHPVADFSLDELERLLLQRGHHWKELPPDLKKLLRNPILAGLFLDQPYTSVLRAPRSEYEIFEGFWLRIVGKGFLGDEGIVTALAAVILDGKAYPLTRPMWAEIGLTDESLARLDSAGWLRIRADGGIIFAHDRLANWAVAKSLERRYLTGQLSVERLGAILSKSGDDQDHAMRGRLGYVPMDTLWLIAKDEKRAEALAEIVAQMEGSGDFGSHGEELYKHLLPTLGQRAVPILLERLKMLITGSESDYRTRLIGQAFGNLARQDHVKLDDVTRSLLSDSSRDRQRVAIAILTEVPHRDRLDQLWQIHQRHVDALADSADNARYEDYQGSFAALRRAIAQDPDWIRDSILAAEVGNEYIPQLGYLLNGLEHVDAPGIWEETGETLMVKMPANKPRSLLYCIARYSDHKKLAFVLQHLSTEEDFASGAALYALSILDPLATIDRLADVSDSTRSLTRNQWLPGLLRAEPERTRQRVLQIAKADPKGHHIIETLFGQRPDDLNEDMLRFVLRALETELREKLEDAINGDPTWLHFPLELLGRISQPNLLALLEAEAFGELERMVTAVACSRLRFNNNFGDHVREGARRVLILMGGDGIDTLIKQELESDHYWARHGGLNVAFMCPGDGIVDRLEAIARRPVPRDANGKRESDPYFEFHQATTALAAIGADAALINAIFECGIPEVPRDLADLRAHKGRISKELTDRARLILQRETAEENELLVALVVAWLSDDEAFIPAVRTVLGKADAEETRAGFACIALQALDDQTEEFAQLALRLALGKENAAWGLDALANLKDRGRELLSQWLQQQKKSAKRSDHSLFALRVLYDHPGTRALSIKAAVAHCLRGRHFGDAPYDIAAEADEPLLREQILDKAFANRAFVVTEPINAIEGLARFDVRRAIDAIEMGLQFHPKIEHRLCRLLVKIAPESAASKLVKVAMSSERVPLWHTVGRALRRLDPDVVTSLIRDQMSGTEAERKAAAELAAWLPIPALTETLGRLADHDSASAVRVAALAALKHHRQEANVQALMASFPGASIKKRWSLLLVILEAGDPYLLTDRQDVLWLGNILTDQVPAIFAHHAKSILQRQKQKIAQ